MAKGDDAVGAILGILGGLALLEILKGLSNKKCPRCGNYNENQRLTCKYCGGRL
ncbi:DNA-directed RNA polymerase subunit RPC12/RpoP [Methanococcus maripaludis]|uniref:DNA-directed RNA polymerase subunit RPC12/RpoP n=1 Tax=Methanococcus maripaludis TaxID=39152 RepID=A0A7J9P3I4_METMI|nr:hypothetical protein [Methanococcus maripaludis]MBA2853943.1 DNA-directed RNA polymerase subunit RPC12/RpoP [Methanococcus maripaludis]